MPVLWRIGLFLFLFGIAILALALYSRHWPLGGSPNPKLELASSIVIALGLVLLVTCRARKIE